MWRRRFITVFFSLLLATFFVSRHSTHPPKTEDVRNQSGDKSPQSKNGKGRAYERFPYFFAKLASDMHRKMMNSMKEMMYGMSVQKNSR